MTEKIYLSIDIEHNKNGYYIHWVLKADPIR